MKIQQASGRASALRGNLTSTTNFKTRIKPCRIAVRAVHEKCEQLIESRRLIAGTSLWRDAWRRLLRNKLAVFGMIVVVIITLLAIRNDVIEPHFQPLVRLKTGETLGFEILARWPHPHACANSAG